MNIFYISQIYQLMRNGISDMHCRSDLYLAKEIEDEKKLNLCKGNQEWDFSFLYIDKDILKVFLFTENKFKAFTNYDIMNL